MENTLKRNRLTFTDFLRQRFKKVVAPIAAFLIKIGLSPNAVTILGLLGHIIAATLVGFGLITAGGIVLLIMAPLDFLDGTMARLRGEETKLGSFLDSVTDRYSEIVIFGGLLAYFLQQQNQLAVILVYLSMVGSILVSYIRAKAESIQLQAKVGLLSRVERYFILIPGLIFNIPLVSLWIIAILANITAIQRIYAVGLQAHKEATK